MDRFSPSSQPSRGAVGSRAGASGEAFVRLQEHDRIVLGAGLLAPPSQYPDKPDAKCRGGMSGFVLGNRQNPAIFIGALASERYGQDRGRRPLNRRSQQRASCRRRDLRAPGADCVRFCDGESDSARDPAGSRFRPARLAGSGAAPGTAAPGFEPERLSGGKNRIRPAPFTAPVPSGMGFPRISTA